MNKNCAKKIEEKDKLHAGVQVEMDCRELETVCSHPDLISVAEYIKKKFYFATLISGSNEPRCTPGFHFFTIDNKLIYRNFNNDFGPLNLSCLYKYCCLVNNKLRNPKYKNIKIIHYTFNDNQESRANAAYLIASFAIICLGKTPHDSYKILMDNNHQKFKPFRDASIGNSLYTIRLQDCLTGLYKAVLYGLFDFKDFNLAEYDKYQDLQEGDINWIIPEKFLAFIGPSSEPHSPYHQPERYIEYFLKNKVAAVVRLNRAHYDESRFTRFGIAHYDMFLPDCSTPSPQLLNAFLRVAEKTTGPIAVHCKAGLGRTGCLIAAYLVKHYNMTAKEAIAWARICRPGSVIGHQQSWLEARQNDLWLAGQHYRLKTFGNSEAITHHKRGIYSNARSTDKKENLSIHTIWPLRKLGLDGARQKYFSQPHDSHRITKQLTQGDLLNQIKFRNSTRP